MAQRDAIDALVERCHAERSASADALEKYGWREGEQEAMQRDLAERQRRDKSEEVLAWANARNQERAEAERAQAEPTVTKAEAAMTGSTQVWESWIKSQIRASQKAAEKPLYGAIADVVCEERKAWKAEIASEREARHKLEQELLALKREVSELRGEAKVRGALDEMTERLDRIEQARQPLRAIGKALSA